MTSDHISVHGAREHNLKNISLEIPRNQLVVLTGVSGSGKSSLAFDTLYAEGQRRYVESLSAYARQFLGVMEKPDVDSIEGLSPAIAIQQKGGSRNPRSTVGTTTEIYDYLRLLYARAGIQHCPQCKRPITRQTVQQMTDHFLALPEGTKLQLLAPLVSGRKGEYKKVFDQARKDGFVRVRVDGKLFDLEEEIPLEKNQKHDIEVVVDRLVMKPSVRQRMTESLETALRQGQGVVKAILQSPGQKESEQLFSEKFACMHCGLSMEELAPRNFSFNNPHGACPACTGMGYKMEVDENLLVDPDKSIRSGAIIPFANSKNGYYQSLLEAVLRHYKCNMDTPYRQLPKNVQDILLHGTEESIEFSVQKGMYSHKFQGGFEGVVPNLDRRFHESESENVREEVERYMILKACRTCGGARLKPESLAVTVGEKNILEATRLSVKDCFLFFENLKLDAKGSAVSLPILKEVRSRLRFLQDVGLDYITLDRLTSTLSGGEAQRIHLATQIGSALMGVMYVLDEPSIGLHQRDNEKLLATLCHLRDLGNTVLVVEHDEATIEAADYLVDIGPGAGVLGGQVVAVGSLNKILKCKESITGQYLSGVRWVDVNQAPRKGNGHALVLKGACKNNLKKLTVRWPLGKMICVTGVSGSGKSTLVMETLLPALLKELYHFRLQPDGYEAIEGASWIDKVIEIDQSPIGRTPRSNSATYTGVFTLIRDLFTSLPESKARGYAEGRFSFNVKGGRCEACQGDGVIRIEMHFLPDVYVSCDNCKGKRYNRETLEIRYKDKNIAEVLDLSVEEALSFFAAVPRIKKVMETLQDVGLGYLKLGQSATTLSGGEAQRIKLSTELARRSTGRTLYILDEPTTGLHFADVHHLIGVLNRLVDAGNTVVVIEHNLDVVKAADHIIDLGPEGGVDGGRLVVEGSVAEVAKRKDSHTGRFLGEKLISDAKRRSGRV
jgi:excinuclease ABC subunit A